jgi:hypothetical protein
MNRDTTVHVSDDTKPPANSEAETRVDEKCPPSPTLSPGENRAYLSRGNRDSPEL